MAEPLKDIFNRTYYVRLAETVWAAAPKVKPAALVKDLLQGNEDRELNARMRHASTVLRRHLPGEFRKAIRVLEVVAPRMPNGYTALLYPDFVGRFGLEDPAFSLDALKYFTVFGSAEFAVREFFRRDVAGTLKTMHSWAGDANEHVRRLASEGSRPRLPWSFRLEAVMQDPALTTPILERLRADGSPYVRRSVANHLNDFSKDHPAYMLGLLRKWGLQHPHTAWIAKHASRTLIKAGSAEALAILAFDTRVQVRVDDLVVRPARLAPGGTLEFAFKVASEAGRSQRLVIDYAIHYRKAGGGTSRKVFKLKEVELGPQATIGLTKRQRFADLSTRKHYPGEHVVEVLVNGREKARAVFLIEA